MSNNSGNGKKIAVLLSGTGVYDGTEIYEGTLTFLALEECGAQYECMAPNIAMHHVINHYTQQPTDEQRNVLVESARLARGVILDLSEANPDDYDALIFPGGFGAAKNLSDFAFKGSELTVDKSVQTFANAIHDAKKPVGLICIAPAMIPKLFGAGIQCTIGTDADTSTAIETMGGIHKECSVDDIVVDLERRIVTTPAYMLASTISEAATGIRKLVAKVVEMS